ncbi:MAG: cysteine synthase family protein [Chloroflexota bacterium]|nr:cysteine synthase family protein [Chloroflexota bacterium]
MPGVHNTIEGAIGNTPLVRLNRVVPDGAAEIYVKIESGNPTGSYKDRMALAMIDEAEKRGDLKPGQAVVEYSGGSTGSSLAFVCAIRNHPLTIVTSNAFAQAKLRTMQAFGARLVLIESPTGQITPDLIPSMMVEAKRIAAEEGAYWTDQFNNADAVAGYRRIGEELLEQLDRPIDIYTGGVGTAGMLTGVASALRAAGRPTEIVALEPASAPLITTGVKGSHRVEGIGVGFYPPLLTEGSIDRAIAIDETEARVMAKRLAREEGIFAGVSSALNVVGAIHLAQELGPGKTVVTVAVDSGLKYLQGDLFE